MKVAIIVFAGTDGDGPGRLANALLAARELQESGDEVRVIFDGAGTKWVPRLVDPEEKNHRLFEQVRESVAGACLYCARAYGVKDEIERAGVPFVDEYKAHPSIRRLLVDGFQILNF
jgi:hypothetical protein